jgi:hypothetical protein
VEKEKGIAAHKTGKCRSVILHAYLVVAGIMYGGIKKTEDFTIFVARSQFQVQVDGNKNNK